MVPGFSGQAPLNEWGFQLKRQNFDPYYSAL